VRFFLPEAEIEMTTQMTANGRNTDLAGADRALALLTQAEAAAFLHKSPTDALLAILAIRHSEIMAQYRHTETDTERGRV